MSESRLLSQFCFCFLPALPSFSDLINILQIHCAEIPSTHNSLLILLFRHALAVLPEIPCPPCNERGKMEKIFISALAIKKVRHLRDISIPLSENGIKHCLKYPVRLVIRQNKMVL